jgi:beta-glucanase (GH16 family)
MSDLSRVKSIEEYNGDATNTDWVYSGEAAIFKNTTLLTMPANSGGTVFASTDYVWYGNIKATLKTSRGAGVITAFILLSDVKDEIDYEFVGADLTVAQTNYYFQGILDCKFSLLP